VELYSVAPQGLGQLQARAAAGSSWTDVGTVSDGAAWPSGAADNGEAMLCDASGADVVGVWEASGVIWSGARPAGGSTPVLVHS
jgi:hypothetical protein